SEDADEDGLLHQPGDDVVLGTPGPEQGGERHVDDDQRGGDEGDLAAEQAEARIDIAGEDSQELVDDAGSAHLSYRPLSAVDGSETAGPEVRPRKRSRVSAQIARHSVSSAAASPIRWQRRWPSRSG